MLAARLATARRFGAAPGKSIPIFSEARERKGTSGQALGSRQYGRRRTENAEPPEDSSEGAVRLRDHVFQDDGHSNRHSHRNCDYRHPDRY